jgi:hypothetical protein
VTITGTNFSTVVTENVVTFNGVAATVSAATATELKVTVPVGATTGKLTIVKDGFTTTTQDDFTILPNIVDFSPKSGKAGDEVTITGTSFGAATDLNVVKFNGVTATVSTATATELKVTVPAGATTGKIAVETAGQTATSTEDFGIANVTGLGQNFTGVALTLFPNPVVGDVLTLQVKGKPSSQTIAITLIDVQGTEVLSLAQPLSGGQLTIPVKALSSGQYIVKIKMGEQTIARRIIKQ